MHATLENPEQVEIPFDRIEQPDVPKTATIQERFEAFHALNPGVYQALKRLALQAKRRGANKWSVKGIFEVLRWHYAMQTKGDVFKLNNVFTSRYARMLMDNEPELDRFFEVRRCLSE